VSVNALVIVESPAKAKTINKYLGKDYTVLASYGHIRDLPSKDGSVLPDDDFAMIWELSSRASKTMSDIKKATKEADTVYLATDPDREGEAISWHIKSVLEDGKFLKNKIVHRVTFNEITKKAVQDAFAHPRELDQNLIEAYLARRALDYLVGFNVSPVLWRKLPGARSAGRVQSVALRLICERESEIEKFRSEEYWSIAATLHTPSGAPFEARLTHLSGNRLDRLDIKTQKEAEAAAARIRNKSLKVVTLEKKQARRHPYAPFITSTLQQEASRKLGFGASQTMRVAQRLYEGIDIKGETVGLITYMRTDGITLSNEAIFQARSVIEREFGNKYVPSSPRMYKSKAKNAQEAHEAIRPTDLNRSPLSLRNALGDDEFRLYDLIWKRTLACQMESAILDQVAADISDGTDDVVLRATGSVVAFDGFLKLYQETRDDPTKDGEDDNENDRRLPPMEQGDALKTISVNNDQHFTQPPPRYSEASLVKKLEEEGIGRPSTYASIIQVLQDRDYVTLDKKRFVPQDRGRLVTTFLAKYFTRYVDYQFTAQLEEELDAISAGHVAWKEALRLFWQDFSKAVGETKELTITDVINALDEDLGPHFFPQGEDGKDPRVCVSCGTGRLGLKLGKFGAFIGCSNYPECKVTKPLTVQDENADAENGGGDIGARLDAGPVTIGDDDAGVPISLRKGPYGVYVQLGPIEGDETSKPKRQGLPRGLSPSDVTLAVAKELLSLPRLVGTHPETQKPIEAGIGRFGPYIKHDGAFISLKKDDDVLSVGMNRAVELIANAPAKGGGAAAKPIRDLGAHPTTKKQMQIFSGRYGPYVKMEKIMASLPKGTAAESLTVEEAVELLAKKAGTKGGKTKATAKKAPAKKTATKKAAPKKPAAKADKEKPAKKSAAKAPAKPKAKAKPKPASKAKA